MRTTCFRIRWARAPISAIIIIIVVIIFYNPIDGFPRPCVAVGNHSKRVLTITLERVIFVRNTIRIIIYDNTVVSVPRIPSLAAGFEKYNIICSRFTEKKESCDRWSAAVYVRRTYGNVAGRLVSIRIRLYYNISARLSIKPPSDISRPGGFGSSLYVEE